MDDDNEKTPNFFDIVDSFFGRKIQDGDECPDCEENHGTIALACACGEFTLTACAKCFAPNKVLTINQLTEHASSCRDARYLLRAIGAA